MTGARKLALQEAAEYIRNLDGNGPGGTYMITIVDDVTGEVATIKVDCDISPTPSVTRPFAGTTH
ncbi:hypothetical protein MOX02_59050 [Methylobacterium oxalidis]|uniref:Uncharacterized protein n=1 Tax=Methylobacterium oxalidis TaxID=944322 RepID=A0A512JD79_9HYPH|nr:hypothetical protein MOX02_59050 [Methylobacterium oxalidis]GLS64455.1 hypothetical protein GCM10007888_28360 [Methylobacterium oxalidis]